jgi:hypothetical protein
MTGAFFVIVVVGFLAFLALSNEEQKKAFLGIAWLVMLGGGLVAFGWGLLRYVFA